MDVIFLIGSDLYSYNFANELCIHCARTNVKASFLVFRNEYLFNPDKLEEEIKSLIFYERTVFSDVLLPYLKNHPNQGQYLGLEALAQKYTINYAFCPYLDNKQALQFILEHVKKWNIDVAISIRCAVKFDKQLIHYFTRAHEHYFWNIHPGRLPQYRGIMPVFGAMLNQEVRYGFTLHRVAEKLDNGPIIDASSQPIDYAKSMLQNTMDLLPLGVNLIVKNLLKVANNKQVPHRIQDETQKGFYSFPSATELALFKSKGLCIYLKDELIKTMQDQYLTKAQRDILNSF